MANISYKYRLELFDPENAKSVPEGSSGSSFLSWKDIKMPVSITDGVVHYWADGWDTIRGVKLTDVKSIIRQTFCDEALIIEEAIWENKIAYKFRLDLIDSSNDMFVPEGKDHPEGTAGDFISWKDIKLPVKIENSVLRYWADGWDTVRGVMLSNVKCIMRQTFFGEELVIEEPIWNNN